MSRKSKEHGFVYLITDETDRVKIGVSKNAERRLIQFRTSNPSVKLFGKIPCRCYDLESFLHKELAQYNVGGEWFSPSDEVILKVFNLVYAHGQEYEAFYIITGNTLM